MKLTHPFHPTPVITIDGPTASGKGTVATLVAANLDFHLLDSGVLYRLVALASVHYGMRLEDVEGFANFVSSLHITYCEGLTQLDGIDVSTEIRAEEISKRASIIAVYPTVRSALIAYQRTFRKPLGLVADGRDMGTVIFPDATLKVFLTATIEARAIRRYNQLMQKGFSVSITSLVQNLYERDQRDSTRIVGPLKPAADAKILDTSTLSIDEVVEQIVQWYWALSV